MNGRKADRGREAPHPPEPAGIHGTKTPGGSLRILGEFVEGFDALAELGPAVTVFGSARIEEGSPTYELARAIGRRLAEAGFAVITGGGPGVMEAANRGARRAAGSRSAATSSCRTSRR